MPGGKFGGPGSVRPELTAFPFPPLLLLQIWKTLPLLCALLAVARLRAEVGTGAPGGEARGLAGKRWWWWWGGRGGCPILAFFHSVPCRPVPSSSSPGRGKVATGAGGKLGDRRTPPCEEKRRGGRLLPCPGPGRSPPSACRRAGLPFPSLLLFLSFSFLFFFIFFTAMTLKAPSSPPPPAPALLTENKRCLNSRLRQPP